MRTNNHLYWDDIVNLKGESIPVPAIVAAATLAHHAAISDRSTSITEDVAVALATTFMLGIDWRQGSSTFKVCGKGGWFVMQWVGCEYRLTRVSAHHMRTVSKVEENDIPDFMNDLPVELD